MSFRLSLTKVARRSAPASMRTFSAMPAMEESSLGPASTKFLNLLEDYRRENFGQALFSKYIRETVRAMDTNGDGLICYNELTSTLRNIGAEDKLSADDIQAVISEMGQGNGEIQIDFVEDLILGNASGTQ